MIPCSLVNSWVLTFCACVFFSQKSRPQDRNSSLTNLKSLFASWNFFVIRHYVTPCKSERNRSASFILFMRNGQAQPTFTSQTGIVCQQSGRSMTAGLPNHCSSIQKYFNPTLFINLLTSILRRFTLSEWKKTYLLNKCRPYIKEQTTFIYVYKQDFEITFLLFWFQPRFSLTQSSLFLHCYIQRKIYKSKYKGI